ncbi:MAG: 30S ribosomal protein S21 [Bacilli bacterium]|nr:30S ribosomal protein S21 [Bacilli bacterium]
MATQVTVKNGNLDMALKKFKQKVARDGVPSECKKRECYDKPGVRRRNAKKEGIKNSRKRDKNRDKKERKNRD